MDAQRLESAGGGMDGVAQRRGALGLRHDSGKPGGAGDGPRRDDGAGDAAGGVFLAVTGDEASVPRSALFTTSAALSPERLILISRGPSSRNEKPRSGWSNWNEDTPRSST